MTGWLGDAYPWVKALHVIFVIFWMAGLFMLPRFFVYHMASPQGTPEDGRWIDRERRMMRIIINPAMFAVWGFGLALAVNMGWSEGWLHAKIALVLALSGYHDWLSKTRKRFAAGERPYAEKTLRLLNEVPALATILIVILVVVRPF
jgi:putative membrane protein